MWEPDRGFTRYPYRVSVAMSWALVGLCLLFGVASCL